MTGRLIFSLIVIAIVLVVVTVFFVLLFKLICCNRRRNKHNKKMVKKLQQQQQLLQQQQQQQRLRQQYNLNKLSYFDEESNGNSHKYADINGNIPSYLNNNNNNRRHYPFNNANYQYFNQPNCEYYQYPKLYYSQHKYKQQNQLQHSSCGNEQKSKKMLAEHIYEFDDPELLNDEVDGKDTSTAGTLKNDSLPNGNNIQIASDENEINNSNNNNNKSTICNNNESEENKKGTKRKASFFSPFNWFRKSDSSFNKNNNCKSNDKSKRPLRVMENGYLNKKARKKMNKKHLKNKKKQKLYEKTLDRYYVIDSSRNGNIYYLFNPMSQSRRLSVIAEEKTSTLSSRSNSTDKTHSIV